MTRIIAGRAKGRHIAAPKGALTRPTADRVREAFFTMLSSWLGTVDSEPSAQLEGISFLDLCAGSGAMGLEAASRGARRVVCVEKAPSVANVISSNAGQLRLDVRVRVSSISNFVQGAAEPFDVVYLDPPYDMPTPDVEQILAALLGEGWLAPRALVVVERSKRTVPVRWPAEYEESWDRPYGETLLQFAVSPDKE